MNKIKLLLGPMRVPFLILTPACVLLGLGTAVWTTGRINIWHFILALIGAISAHISVNAFNEYFDFKSGLDAHTHRTPFSGGSGTLQQHPQAARLALVTAILTFARALGEFGAVLVVGGGIQGRTESATLYIFRALDQRQYVGAYSAALMLGLLSLVLVVGSDLLRKRGN